MEKALTDLIDCVEIDFDPTHPLLVRVKAALASGKEGSSGA